MQHMAKIFRSNPALQTRLESANLQLTGVWTEGVHLEPAESAFVGKVFPHASSVPASVQSSH